MKNLAPRFIRTTPWALLASLLVVGVACPELARAAGEPAESPSLSACGHIHVEAEAECELVPPNLECKGMCTPLSVQATCSAQLAVDCEGSCDELPSVECEGSCQGSCEADCEKLEPGELDCQGHCEADCSGRCEGNCEGNEDSASCEGSCEGSCAASCEGSCEVTPPEADCEASCEASCEGSCTVDPNLECQVECQAKGQAGCEAVVEGGCELACEGENGALFCDGQYVDHGDNLEQCLAALKAVLHVHVEGSAEASSDCDDAGCHVEAAARAKVTTDCSAAAPGSRRSGQAGLVVLALGAALFGWRSRRARPRA